MNRGVMFLSPFGQLMSGGFAFKLFKGEIAAVSGPVVEIWD